MIIKRAAEGQKQYSRGRKSYTEEEVYQLLLEYAKELGAVPHASQIRKKSKEDPDFPSTSTVSRKIVNFDWRRRITEDLGLFEEEPEELQDSPDESEEESEAGPERHQKVSGEPEDDPEELEEDPEEVLQKSYKLSLQASPADYVTDNPESLESELFKWLESVAAIGAISGDFNAFSTFRLKTGDIQVDVTINAFKPQPQGRP